MLMAREEEGVFCVYNTVVRVCLCVCVCVCVCVCHCAQMPFQYWTYSNKNIRAFSVVGCCYNIIGSSSQVHNHVSLPSLLPSLPPSTTGHQVTATCLSASMSPTPLIAITARGGAGNTSTRTRRGTGTTPLQSRAYPVRAFSVSFHPRA